MSTPEREKSLGQIFVEAALATDDSLSGSTLPTWEEYPEHQRRIVDVAAQAVADEAVRRQLVYIQENAHTLQSFKIKEQSTQIAELRAAMPFPALTAGTADAIAYQLEIGKENHSCPVDDAAIAAWLRSLSKELIALAKSESKEGHDTPKP